MAVFLRGPKDKLKKSLGGQVYDMPQNSSPTTKHHTTKEHNEDVFNDIAINDAYKSELTLPEEEALNYEEFKNETIEEDISLEKETEEKIKKEKVLDSAKQTRERQIFVPDQEILAPTSLDDILNEKIEAAEQIISPIIDLATTRPAETIKDFDVRIDKNKFVSPDKRVNQNEFDLLMKGGDYKYLDLSHFKNIQDFRALSCQTGLVHLSLCGNTQLRDISFLKSLKNLEVLDLGLTGVIDLSYIKYLTNLKVLNIRYTEIRDISPLSNLKNLRDLVIMGCARLIDTRPIQHNTELRLIDANDALSVNDISCVSSLKKLENLFLDFCPLRSIDSVRQLHSLKAFSLESKNLQIRNIVETFADLTELRCLNLKKSRIMNIKPLEKLTNMIALDIGYGNFISVEPLYNMKNLRRAHIDENSGIVDLSPLEQMKDLMVLDISGDKVSDLSVLKNFQSLNEFDAMDNIVLQDLAPLEYCTQISCLLLDGCLMISDLYPLRKLTNLSFVTLNRLPRLIDISPLKEAKNLFLLEIDSTSVPYSQITEFKLQKGLSIISTIGSNEHYRRAKSTFKRRRKLNNLRISLDF